MRSWAKCRFIPGLSVEDPEEMEIKLDHVCKLISRGEMDPAQHLPALPGVQFALETALTRSGNGRARASSSHLHLQRAIQESLPTD